MFSGKELEVQKSEMELFYITKSRKIKDLVKLKLLTNSFIRHEKLNHFLK